MTAELATIIPMLIGGIALFLMGMELLGDGLKRVAGLRVQAMLANATESRLRAAGLGAFTSTLIHSGPATVIVLGFVNAGVITLTQSVPLVFGANIGTTLSMQIVAFNVGHYCFAVLAVGVLMRKIFSSRVISDLSLAIIGFGLLFLGLETIKVAFAPLKDSDLLMNVLAILDTSTTKGFLQALFAGILLTVIFQSSGVIISLLFSLSALGVITDYNVAVPYILGAHIGTCSMTLLAAPGGSASAWRTAYAHVLFNVVGAGLAIAMLPLYDRFIPQSTSDVTRQIANFNTAKQVLNVAILLPFAGLFEKALRVLTPWLSKREEEPSHLDPKLLAMPEDAILAVVRELRRQAGIVNEMLRSTLDGLVTLDLGKLRGIESQEKAVDVIKRQVTNYIGRIAKRSLEPRQAVMLQRLVLASSAIERLGDHVEGLGWLSRKKVREDVWFADEHMHGLLKLSHLLGEMLDDAREAIDPTEAEARVHARHALRRRGAYNRATKELKESIHTSLYNGTGNADTALLLHNFIAIFDRMAEQLRILARQESKQSWSVHSSGLQRVEPLAPRSGGRPNNHPVHESFEEAVRDLRLREISGEVAREPRTQS